MSDAETPTGRTIRLIKDEAQAPLLARIERLEAAAAEIDRYLLVIESAVRNADPSQHRAVLAALQANGAALAGRGGDMTCLRTCFRAELGGHDPLWEARAEIERLKAAIAWTLEVYPGKNREGGAVVEMTWDQFNTMRTLAGKV